MGKAPFDRLSQLMTCIAAGIATLIGLTVLVGWHAHSVSLVQLAASLAPMQYNSALSFVLSGVGLLALMLNCPRLAAMCGILVAVLGGLTLVEYLSDASLGIDQLFMVSDMGAYTAFPGRMDPNSALCFTLTGISLFVMSRGASFGWTLPLAGPLGAIVLALGSGACLGYLTGLKMYSWGYFADMPPLATLGGISLGAGILAVAWRLEATRQSTAQPRVAVLVGIGVLTVTLCLWQALVASEETRVERTVELVKVSVHNELMAEIQSHILPLVRMTRHWETQGKPSKEAWEADADLYVGHYPDVQAFAWVDASFHVQWVAPREGNEATQGLDLGFDEQRRSALELSRNSRQVTATGALDLVTGGRGFHVYVPIMRGTSFEGLIVGIYRIQDLFDAILGHVAPRYSVAVFEGAKEIYGRYDAGRKYEKKWAQETTVGLYGTTWRIRIWPTPALVAEELLPLPEVVLGVGLLTDALLVLALYLAHIAQQRATQVDIGNQALRREISEHTRTGGLLADRVKQMEAVRAVTMEITRELDLTTLLSLITRRAIDLVAAAQAGAIYLWDESTQVLTPHAWYGPGEWMEQVQIRLSEGIVGTVAQRQEGRLDNNYQHSSYAQPFAAEHFGSTAIVAEPLLYRDRLVGVIVLNNRGNTQLFAREDRELLVFFAAQAAIAIENARLYKSMGGRFTRVQTLTRLNQLVSSSLDTTKVLSEIAGAAATLMDAAEASFWFVDETTRTLEMQAFSDENIGADFPSPKVSFEQGDVGWVAMHRRVLNVPDVFADDRFMALDWWRAHDLCSFFGIPIMHEDTLIAVLAIYGRQPFRFGPDDQSLLDSFVAQAAVAIRNARLFAEIRGHTAHLTELNTELQNEISEREYAEEALQHQTALVKLLQSAAVAANEARIIDEAMQTVVNEVCTFTGWPVGHVYVIDKDAAEHLMPTTIWHLEDPHRFETFRRITEATRFASGQGLPGRVLASGKSAWITDVTTDHNFPRAAMGTDIGVRAGFAFPVLVGAEVVAVLEFFADDTVGPDEALLEIVGHIGTQLGRLVERQRSEEALRVSEIRFRSVVQAATDAIILSDSQGRIITWNNGAQSIFGYTEAEVLGRPLTMLMPVRYRKAHQRGVERLMSTGQAQLLGKSLEFHGLRKDGHEFPLELSLATWEITGSMFCSGIIRDITERQQAVEQLQRQQEALYQREKLAAMGSLLASVAHELNNPLSVVMMQADLLSVELQDEAVVARIKEVSQSAERCVHIVRNFLALARQNPPQRTSVALNTVVGEALALLAYALRVDDIDVEQQLAADLPSLWADQHQLYQVVVNLITNAQQALRESPPPRRLTLTTLYEPAQGLICLEVGDTGPGIPPELQDRIFEPFFTTKAPGVGTGLGLPFCRGIIEGHGGSIAVDSVPGRGTVFRISLQISVQVEAPPLVVPAPALEAPPPADKGVILVIDDEPGITGALAYLLRRDGHTVDTAANGRLALAKLQERAYDLILCDLRMPELDGRGFYRELERSYPHLVGRVIFLTGDSLSPDAREFLEKVGVWQLSKPFRASEVRRAVQQALHTG